MKKKSFLVLPPDTFKEQLLERLHSGKDLLAFKEKDENTLADLSTSFKRWDFFNQELLRQAFDSPDNRYVMDYLNAKRLDFTIKYRKEPITIEERFSRIEKKLENQMRYLEQLLEILPLLIQNPENIEPLVSKEKIKRLIEKNSVYEALDQLLKLKLSTIQKNELILIKSSLNTMDHKFNLKLISLEEFEETTYKLKKAILNMVDTFEHI